VEPYAGFVLSTLQTEAAFIGAVTKTVSQKAKVDAEHGLKLLRYRNPEDWSPTRKQAVATIIPGNDGPVIQMSLADFMEAQQRLRGEGNA
jgi:glycine cleavage system regulatory protein